MNGFGVAEPTITKQRVRLLHRIGYDEGNVVDLYLCPRMLASDAKQKIGHRVWSESL